MTEKSLRTKNDNAWEIIFEKYNVLKCIERDGQFKISAEQIKEASQREPRLMAKFDHSINRPSIFVDHNLSILPISRGDYIISHYKAYADFPSEKERLKGLKELIPKTLPEYVQSLNSNNVVSEALAINCAYASGILADFICDELLLPTASGRMGAGQFDFRILNECTKDSVVVTVDNSQIEIDAAFEGLSYLTLIEAKRDLASDFLIRQLYYPYRLWKSRVSKTIRPIFLVYSNSVFSLYEYSFTEPNDYNSLVLVQQKNYTLENARITVNDVDEVAKSVITVGEPREIPFPQADNFERVVNLCVNILNEKDFTVEQLTENFAFDVRQTYYYTDAARYLGLVERYVNENGSTAFRLSALGKNVACMDYRKRSLEFCRLMLGHVIFKRAYDLCLEQRGTIPSREDIAVIMRDVGLNNVNSDDTRKRRATTVRQWLNWIFSIVDEN